MVPYRFLDWYHAVLGRSLWYVRDVMEILRTDQKKKVVFLP